jgi:hypothetical protein
MAIKYPQHIMFGVCRCLSNSHSQKQVDELKSIKSVENIASRSDRLTSSYEVPFECVHVSRKFVLHEQQQTE